MQKAADVVATKIILCYFLGDHMVTISGLFENLLNLDFNELGLALNSIQHKLAQLFEP